MTYLQAFALPWPPADLSPNKRQHYMALARAKKRYRAACWASVLEQRVQQPPKGQLAVELQFCPPDRRAHDQDNLVARMKSGLDGVADALSLDDNRFKIQPRDGEVTKGGCVCVRLTQA